MVLYYVYKIIKGTLTLDDVPERWKKEVEEALS